MVQIGKNSGDPQNLVNFNDFDVRLAGPLGRLGASRPPAAEEGIPVKADSRGDLRNSSLRSQALRVADA